MKISFLVWLEWKEKCFRATKDDVAYLQTILPKSAKIIWVHSERAFLKALPQATHALVWHFKAPWYEVAKNLKVLATPAAGQELIAPPPSTPNAPIVHFGHFHGQLMSESVAAFILGWARGFFRRRPDSWGRVWLSDKVTEVAGTRAAIIGFGHVGQAIGAKLEALGVEIKGKRRSETGEKGEWEAYLRTADWVILTLPSTTGTDNYVNDEFLRQLKRSAVLINVGRGNAVDEVALAAALKAKRLAGAYLDVRKVEASGTVPVFGQNSKELEKMENCVMMPHSSAFSPKYVKLAMKEMVGEKAEVKRTC